jgi:hypothetical protein
MEHDVLAYTAFPPGALVQCVFNRERRPRQRRGCWVPGMTPLGSAFVASASQCLPGDPRLAAVA